MALDDAAFNNEAAASLLKALRENAGFREDRDSINGNSYSSGDFFPTVADGATRNVFIENPSDSGVIIFSKATFRSGAQILYHKVDSVTVDTAGTTLDSHNRLIDNGVSQARVESEISYSGGDPWTKKTSGGAAKGGGTAPGVGIDFDIILQEGENVLYELENSAGREINTTIDVDYTEVDVEEVDELL